MTLGALVDAGADLNFVLTTLKELNVDGWSLSAELVERQGIRATRAIVDAPEQHHHRHWSDIQELLQQSSLPERVKSRSLAVFETLAVAEGKVHWVPPEEVHFHEVGALDAIVDIVGACAALESLNIDEIASGPVAVGVGTISAAHGVLPNPPPAVVNLLEDVPTVGVDVDLELTTPTGSAIWQRGQVRVWFTAKRDYVVNTCLSHSVRHPLGHCSTGKYKSGLVLPHTRRLSAAQNGSSDAHSSSGTPEGSNWFRN